MAHRRPPSPPKPHSATPRDTQKRAHTSSPSAYGNGQTGRIGSKARSLRRMNIGLTLRHILADAGNATRASIAQKTEITPATVSRLVDELIAAGLVTELPPVGEPGRGRPAMRLRPTPGRVVALGLEVNISALDARLIDLAGNVIAQARVSGDFSNSDPTDTMEKLAQVAQKILTDAGITLPAQGHPTNTDSGVLTNATDRDKSGIDIDADPIFLGTGLALPGLVSTDSLALAPNLGWKNVPFAALLEPLADLNVQLIANEADLASHAVAYPLPAVPSGPASFLFVSGEVGVGAGLVVDYTVQSGAHGWSGEIGHVCADPAGPVCTCGATGCLEAFIGRRSLAVNAGLPKDASVKDILIAAGYISDDTDEAHRNTEKTPELVRSTTQVAQSPKQDKNTRPDPNRQHDPDNQRLAQAALEQAGAALGRALSAAVNLIDLPLVLVGGTIAELAPYVTATALQEMQTRTLQSPWIPPAIEILPDSTLLGVTGAAHSVLKYLADDPLRWME